MKTEKYIEQIHRLPTKGHQLIGRIEGENIVVYQAYNNAIADYAISNQCLGGSAYSYNRMSWIKPGFLWMMYRSGWASKENQERILAITLPLIHFDTILQQATISSFSSHYFSSQEEWKKEMDTTEARLQWDPDHDPYGKKIERRAIQIGIKGSVLQKFGMEWILKIEDITDFVKEQYVHVKADKMDSLLVPYEEIIFVDDAESRKRLGLEK